MHILYIKYLTQETLLTAHSDDANVTPCKDDYVVIKNELYRVNACIFNFDEETLKIELMNVRI
jgi:hypothetical protein